MAEFVSLVIFRWMSGAQNGAGYARDNRKRMALTLLMAVSLTGISLGWFAAIGWHWRMLPVAFFALASMAGTLGVEDSFNGSVEVVAPDIHFFELLATGGITLAWAAAGGNLIAIAAAAYPGLILHKGMVNLGSGLPWWDERTDDATGKTFSVPLLGIQVPRLAVAGRITLALASVVAAVVAHAWRLHFSVYDILPILTP